MSQQRVGEKPDYLAMAEKLEQAAQELRQRPNEKRRPSDLEQVESLEQLRVLTAGHTIQIGVISAAQKGIDTQADYQSFVKRFKE